MKTSYEVLMTETGDNARAPPIVHNPNFNTLFFKYIFFFRDLHTELCISAYTGKMFFVTDRNKFQVSAKLTSLVGCSCVNPHLSPERGGGWCILYQT